MSIETLHYLAGISSRGSDTGFPVLTDGAVAYNHEHLQVMQEAHYDPTFQTVMSAKPDIRYTTYEIARVLDLIGMTGLVIDNENEPETDLYLYFRRSGQLGVVDDRDDEVHKRFSLTKGLHYALSLSAQVQQPATIQARVKPIWDGTNAPLIYAGDQAIDVFTENQTPQVFTLGPIKFGTTLLDGVRNMQLDFGCQLFEGGADDDLYDTAASITAITPRLTITTLHPEFLSTIVPYSGLSQSCRIWLRRKSNNGAHFANNATQHMYIDCAYGHWVPASANGRMQQPGEFTYEFRPNTNSTTTNPYVIQTGVAIT